MSHAVESDLVLQKSRIEESKQLHSEIWRKIEATRKQKVAISSENELLNSFTKTKHTELAQVLDKLFNLEKESQLIQSKIQKDSYSLSSLSNLFSEKKSQLDKVEGINRKLRNLIDERNSLRTELKLLSGNYDTTQQQGIIPKIECLKSLKPHLSELQRKKKELISCRDETRIAINATKVRFMSVPMYHEVLPVSGGVKVGRNQE